MTTEEMALLGSVAKFGMGMRHGDGNTRQCMATAVTAYKQSFGFDAPPYTYRDLEESDVVVLVGSNLCIAHPILWERISRNPHSPKIIVVDPRRTETASAATHHLQIAPKTDLELFYSVAQLLIERDCIDRQYIEQHTTGFREFADLVRPYSVSRAATATGLQQEQIEQFAEMIHHGKRVSFWWTMGVNQSYQGVRTAQSLINLALLTGNIGRPGTGANSITGQCNAMGSRLFSNTTCLLGGRDFADPEDRLEVADILGIPESAIPEQSSWPYDTILSRIRTGDIRALWIIATNPAHSWIDQNEARDLLAKLDFLVVQDMYHNTETAQLADLVLPAAGWGEKTGTFINSERRIGLTQQACVAPGEALSDFSIFKLVAEYWGCGSMFDKWESPAAAFEILRELSRNQPCDFTGIADYQALCDLGGVQWPCREPAERACSERRLFEDGKFFHADGRACFVAEAPQAMPEVPCDKYPFLLLTGRGSVAQWHTQTRTSKSPVLRKLSPQQLYIEIHPVDAKRLGVHNGEAVHVASRRGSLVAKVSVTATVRPGQAFLPMHYEASNKLTLAHFDPYSRQPSYKDCAVNITPAISSGDQR
jgi:assimilatory nitrate reductase catalytic subunit